MVVVDPEHFKCKDCGHEWVSTRKKKEKSRPRCSNKDCRSSNIDILPLVKVVESTPKEEKDSTQKEGGITVNESKNTPTTSKLSEEFLDDIKDDPQKLKFFNSLRAAGIKNMQEFFTQTFFEHQESDPKAHARWLFREFIEYRVPFLSAKAFLRLYYGWSPQDVGIGVRDGRVFETKDDTGTTEDIGVDDADDGDFEERELKSLERQVNTALRSKEREVKIIALKKQYAELTGTPYNSTPVGQVGTANPTALQVGVGFPGSPIGAYQSAAAPNTIVRREIAIGWKADGSAEKKIYEAPLAQYQEDMRTNPLQFQDAPRPQGLGEAKPQVIDPIAFAEKTMGYYNEGKEIGFEQGGGGRSVIGEEELKERERLNYERGKLMGELEKSKDILEIERAKAVIEAEKAKALAMVEVEKTKKAIGEKSETMMIHEENMKHLETSSTIQLETIKTEMEAVRTALKSHGDRMAATTQIVSQVGERVIKKLDEDEMELEEEEEYVEPQRPSPRPPQRTPQPQPQYQRPAQPVNAPTSQPRAPSRLPRSERSVQGSPMVQRALPEDEPGDEQFFDVEDEN